MKFNDMLLKNDVADYLQLAVRISDLLCDEKVRSAYVVFAMLCNSNSEISKYIHEYGIYIQAEEVLNQLISDKELFADIFGENAATKFFEALEESEEKNGENEAKSEEDGPDVINLTEFLQDFLEEELGRFVLDFSDSYSFSIIYSDKFENALKDAALRCKAGEQGYVDGANLLYSILKNKDTSAVKLCNIVLSEIKRNSDDLLLALELGYKIFTSYENKKLVIPESIKNFCSILNEKFEVGVKSDILGRDKEIFKLINVFSKRTKRNAILIGPPGAGKTSIIEAITQSIVNKECPKEFHNYTVLSLDVNAMVAGTKYRGEFEEKVALLKRFLENTSNIILFVDEAHQMLGAGGTSDGTVDLSGSLKPILARDDVIFVGATTTIEYEKIFSRDGAFKRRFEVVYVREPKVNEVKKFIRLKVKNLEKHHGVKLKENLLDYIIVCASCFNHETANPDKTIDLCDRSMAIAKMRQGKTVTKADIEKVYEENFEKFNKMDKKVKEALAYHEAGHYLATKLSMLSKKEEVIAVSLVPGFDFLGVNIFEISDEVILADLEYAQAYIGSLLAGRIAEKMVNNGKIDSGASSDLRKATEYAKNMILKYGMDEEDYPNMYFEGEEMASDKFKNKLAKKVNAIIQDAYDSTEELLEENSDVLKRVANLLMEKKIATAEELEKAVKG